MDKLFIDWLLSRHGSAWYVINPGFHTIISVVGMMLMQIPSEVFHSLRGMLE